jgi:hypothetical protein
MIPRALATQSQDSKLGNNVSEAELKSMARERRNNLTGYIELNNR